MGGGGCAASPTFVVYCGGAAGGVAGAGAVDGKSSLRGAMNGTFGIFVT